MALNRLVWNCFLQKTSFEESRLKVAISPNSDEKVLFFRTDSADGRLALGIASNEPASDVVVFYRCQNAAPVFLLVELKSSDLSHAVDQLNRVYQALSGLMPGECPALPRPRFKALVVMSCGSPSNKVKALQRGAKGLDIKLKAGARGGSVGIREYV